MTDHFNKIRKTAEQALIDEWSETAISVDNSPLPSASEYVKGPVIDSAEVIRPLSDGCGAIAGTIYYSINVEASKSSQRAWQLVDEFCSLFSFKRVKPDEKLNFAEVTVTNVGIVDGMYRVNLFFNFTYS